MVREVAQVAMVPRRAARVDLFGDPVDVPVLDIPAVWVRCGGRAAAWSRCGYLVAVALHVILVKRKGYDDPHVVISAAAATIDLPVEDREQDIGTT